MKGWGVSVLVGWTDMYDVATRPIQLIAGRTWKGSLFGGEMTIPAYENHYHYVTGSYMSSAIGCQSQEGGWNQYADDSVLFMAC